MVYDRFTGKQLNDDDLPKSFDLGRYAILNTPDTNDWIDVSNGDSERFRGIDVNQPILDDKHQNIHDLLSLISESFRVSPDGTFPIIQEFESGIRPFEDLLITNLEKLRAIGDNPHSLLERNTVKVNIGRAKRGLSVGQPTLDYNMPKTASRITVACPWVNIICPERFRCTIFRLYQEISQVSEC